MRSVNKLRRENERLAEKIDGLRGEIEGRLRRRDRDQAKYGIPRATAQDRSYEELHKFSKVRVSEKIAMREKERFRDLLAPNGASNDADLRAAYEKLRRQIVSEQLEKQKLEAIYRKLNNELKLLEGAHHMSHIFRVSKSLEELYRQAEYLPARWTPLPETPKQLLAAPSKSPLRAPVAPRQEISKRENSKPRLLVRTPGTSKSPLPRKEEKAKTPPFAAPSTRTQTATFITSSNRTQQAPYARTQPIPFSRPQATPPPSDNRRTTPLRRNQTSKSPLLVKREPERDLFLEAQFAKVKPRAAKPTMRPGPSKPLAVPVKLLSKEERNATPDLAIREGPKTSVMASRPSARALIPEERPQAAESRNAVRLKNIEDALKQVDIDMGWNPVVQEPSGRESKLSNRNAKTDILSKKKVSVPQDPQATSKKRVSLPQNSPTPSKKRVSLPQNSPTPSKKRVSLPQNTPTPSKKEVSLPKDSESQTTAPSKLDPQDKSITSHPLKPLYHHSVSIPQNPTIYQDSSIPSATIEHNTLQTPSFPPPSKNHFSSIDNRTPPPPLDSSAEEALRGFSRIGEQSFLNRVASEVRRIVPDLSEDSESHSINPHESLPPLSNKPEQVHRESKNPLVLSRIPENLSLVTSEFPRAVEKEALLILKNAEKLAAREPQLSSNPKTLAEVVNTHSATQNFIDDLPTVELKTDDLDLLDLETPSAPLKAPSPSIKPESPPIRALSFPQESFDRLDTIDDLQDFDRLTDSQQNFEEKVVINRDPRSQKVVETFDAAHSKLADLAEISEINRKCKADFISTSKKNIQIANPLAKPSPESEEVLNQYDESDDEEPDWLENENKKIEDLNFFDRKKRKATEESRKSQHTFWGIDPYTKVDFSYTQASKPHEEIDYDEITKNLLDPVPVENPPRLSKDNAPRRSYPSYVTTSKENFDRQTIIDRENQHYFESEANRLGNAALKKLELEENEQRIERDLLEGQKDDFTNRQNSTKIEEFVNDSNPVEKTENLEILQPKTNDRHSILGTNPPISPYEVKKEETSSSDNTLKEYEEFFGRQSEELDIEVNANLDYLHATPSNRSKVSQASQFHKQTTSNPNQAPEEVKSDPTDPVKNESELKKSGGEGIIEDSEVIARGGDQTRRSLSSFVINRVPITNYIEPVPPSSDEKIKDFTDQRDIKKAEEDLQILKQMFDEDQVETRHFKQSDREEMTFPSSKPPKRMSLMNSINHAMT